jgi:hypothetical protein
MSPEDSESRHKKGEICKFMKSRGKYFVFAGNAGIIATIITGLTAFSNKTADYIAPFIVLGVLISILIVELGSIYKKMEERKDDKEC